MQPLLKHCRNKRFPAGIISRVDQTIQTYRMLQPHDSVLIAVSGGPDSVALCHLLFKSASKYSLQLGIAHLNHGLRPRDGDRDANFVLSLAEKLNLPFYLEKKDVRPSGVTAGLSLEEAARQARYSFLDDLAIQEGFNKIALGHHLNDNAEHVLMYLFRGSGSLGISGIPPMRKSRSRKNRIIRPLIHLSKGEILNFLSHYQIPFVDDTTNRDIRFVRNKIRHRLIPSLTTEYNPKLVESLHRFSLIMQSEENWINELIRPLFTDCIQSVDDNEIRLDSARLQKMHLAVKRRIIRKAVRRIKGNLRKITLAHIDHAIGLLDQEGPLKTLHFPDRIKIESKDGRLSVKKEKNSLRAARSDDALSIDYEYFVSKPGVFFIKEINRSLLTEPIGVENLPIGFKAGQNTAFFDMNTIRFPLIIRNIRPGDRFSPLGMGGTQKIKKYLINNKIPPAEREKTPLLLSGGKIIWVIGHQIDHAVRLRPDTRQVLKTELVLA